MALAFDIPLFPSQREFVFSDAPIIFFIGPQGEGKTHAGFCALLYHANRVGGFVRGALVRDTHENIKSMTVPSIKDMIASFPDEFAGPFVWRQDFHRLNWLGRQLSQ